MRFVIAWAQQPTSVAGLSAVIGTVSALLTRQITWPQAVPLLAGAIVSILVPDNSVVKGDAEAVAGAIASRMFTRKE